MGVMGFSAGQRAYAAQTGGAVTLESASHRLRGSSLIAVALEQ
jgi:hypothetical protein